MLLEAEAFDGLGGDKVAHRHLQGRDTSVELASLCDSQALRIRHLDNPVARAVPPAARRYCGDQPQVSRARAKESAPSKLVAADTTLTVFNSTAWTNMQRHAGATKGTWHQAAKRRIT